jgi:hypothetical protein
MPVYETADAHVVGAADDEPIATNIFSDGLYATARDSANMTGDACTHETFDAYDQSIAELFAEQSATYISSSALCETVIIRPHGEGSDADDHVVPPSQV